MAGVERSDLGQHRRHLTRLGMGDVDTDLAIELGELLRQGLGREVPTDLGQVGLVVAKGRFDHQLGDALALQGLPERRVGARVARVDPQPMRRGQAEAHARHRVGCRQHRDFAVGQATARRKVQHLPHGHFMQGQDGVGGAGQAREIRPDHPIEDVLAQGLDGLRQGMDLDGLEVGQAARSLAQADHAVGQQGHTQDVVEVAVAEQDVVNARQLVQPQLAHPTACVDEDVVIEQEGGGVAARRNRTVTTKDADHAVCGSCKVGLRPERTASGCQPARSHPRS